MCGLFGIIRIGGLHPGDETTVEALAEQLRHRGPDGSGFIREPDAILGMHRLSIMDPAHGWQPFWSENGRFGVLGNGEIYNAATLREQLRDQGHTFTTESDIEVIPHLVEEHGAGAFLRLRGMFALVVLDRERREVLLVRDRLGEKPLAYWKGGGAFYFSSEQSALVRAGITPLRIDQEQLPGYLLHGYTPEPGSLIDGMQKVPAGHYVRISLEDDNLSECRYWNPLDDVGDTPLSDADIALALEDAVMSTCTSDVPVGIALSGGLDSSLVASIASRMRTDLHAFTVGYETGVNDESALARELANRLAIPCETLILRTQEIADDFAAVCGQRDEPISDIAGPAIAALPRAAREAGVPVLLTGIGGDELFWGYDWMRQLAVWTSNYAAPGARSPFSRVPRFTPPPRVIQAQVDWLTGVGGLRNDFALRSFMHSGARDNSIPLPFYEFQPSHRDIRRGMTELLAGLDSRVFSRPEFRGVSDDKWVPAYYTIASNDTYLRVNSFVQVDRLSMHYSVESRSPLADQQLVSTILSGRRASQDHLLPPKARMKSIAREFLPSDVINRPKRGFTPPVREWVRAIWKQNADSLSAPLLSTLGGLSPEMSTRWLRSPITRAGRINQVALRLLTLELWLRSLE